MMLGEKCRNLSHASALLLSRLQPDRAECDQCGEWCTQVVSTQHHPANLHCMQWARHQECSGEHGKHAGIYLEKQLPHL